MAKRKAARLGGKKLRAGDQVAVTIVATVDESTWGFFLIDGERPGEVDLMVPGYGAISLPTDDSGDLNNTTAFLSAVSVVKIERQ